MREHTSTGTHIHTHSKAGSSVISMWNEQRDGPVIGGHQTSCYTIRPFSLSLSLSLSISLSLPLALRFSYSFLLSSFFSRSFFRFFFRSLPVHARFFLWGLPSFEKSSFERFFADVFFPHSSLISYSNGHPRSLPGVFSDFQVSLFLIFSFCSTSSSNVRPRVHIHLLSMLDKIVPNNPMKNNLNTL